MPDGQLEPGALLNGRYRIIRVIGRGGMGTVYLAEHERLNTVLAAKEITPVAAGSTEQVTMDQYEQEARLLVRLNHPNLPKVTDAFVEGDRFYLIMEFVDGVTLDARLRELGGKPIEPEAVVNWAIEIADVLIYLHQQDPPIIFRDLKPSNVMVQPDGHIKLIDFGIARRFHPGATQDTSLLGSVGYSPPEQFGRHQTDTRSDIYALGATMHHLLTARDPSTTPFKFPPLDQVVLNAPVALSRLTAQCVAMEPELRPPDVQAVSAELRLIRADMQRYDAAKRSSQLQSTISDARQGAVRLSSGGSAMQAPVPISASSAGDRWLRLAVMVVGAILVVGSASYAIHVAQGRSASVRRSGRIVPGSAVPGSVPTGTAIPAQPGNVASASEGSKPAQDTGTQSTGTSQPDGQTGSAVPPTDSKSAQCNVEVLGPSPDGKSLRLHVTGQINGKKDTAGMVAAYFYNMDKTPLLARDPKGPYASPTGQLYAEFSFQIDADSKPIDGVLDVPVEQFTTTNNLMFKCIIYSDNQSAGQTDLLPLSADAPSSPGS